MNRYNIAYTAPSKTCTSPSKLLELVPEDIDIELWEFEDLSEDVEIAYGVLLLNEEETRAAKATGADIVYTSSEFGILTDDNGVEFYAAALLCSNRSKEAILEKYTVLLTLPDEDFATPTMLVDVFPDGAEEEVEYMIDYHVKSEPDWDETDIEAVRGLVLLSEAETSEAKNAGAKVVYISCDFGILEDVRGHSYHAAVLL